MQKRAIMPFLLVLLLIIIGCTMPDISWPFGQATPSTGKGIKLEFIEYPKTDLTDNEPFRIKMLVSNYGNSPLEGFLCLIDSPSSRYEGIPIDQSASCVDVHLSQAEEISDGKYSPSKQDYSFPPGGFYSYKNIEKGTTQTSTITSIFKYVADSKATTPICAQTLSANPKLLPKSCENEQTISDIKQPDFPLKITKIEKSVSPISPTESLLKLKIYIQNTEDGQVIPKDTIFEQTSTYKPEVEFEPRILGNPAAFTCTPLKEGKFELRESEKIINCRATLNIAQGYLDDILELELNYGFEKIMSLPQQIKLVSSQQIA